MRKRGYDTVLVGRAATGLVLRVAVAGYIVYLAWEILKGTLSGDSPLPDWGAWLIFAAFVAAALAFCVFAWKQFNTARIASRNNPDLKAEHVEEESESSKKDD